MRIAQIYSDGNRLSASHQVAECKVRTLRLRIQEGVGASEIG